jgi:hypothetical protein
MTNVRGVIIIDPDNPTTQQAGVDANGNLNVVLQDQSTFIVDLYLHKIDASVTIGSNTSIDDVDVTFSAGHGISVGDLICFKEGVRFYQGIVLVVNVNLITLDTPLDFAYTTAATASRGSNDAAVDGSGTTQVFSIQPPASATWDVTRLIFHIEDQTVMDSSKFGGITALTNGVVVRKKNTTYQNIFNIKSNGDFAHRAYDIAYDDKAPAGTYGFRCRNTFGGQDKRGVVVRLDGDDSDEIQVLVQDDLTGLVHFHIIAQGHVTN